MADYSKETKGPQKTSRSKSKIIIFTIEVFLILIMLAILFWVMSQDSCGPQVVEFDPENLGINDEVLNNNNANAPSIAPGVMVDSGYMNIALFGVDATKPDYEELYKGNRSDCIMIASVNMDTGDIKLVSVYRDTYLNLGTDKYSKCNSAYFTGGAEQAIKMLNMNLDMDITNFIAVYYPSLINLIDGLGGIYIDVDKNELKHINSYQETIAKDIYKNKDAYTPVTETGYQKLNGLQATAFCRIRYIAGDDFKRASNQREVIKAIEEQAKKMAKENPIALTQVFNQVIKEVYTSMGSEDLLQLVGNIGNYRIVDEGGFPEESMRTTGNIGATGSCVIPLDLESNVIWLHEFLFEDEDYTPSSTVKECSAKIKADTSTYINR